MERIVVGIDGSEGAKAALRWAVDEAERHGAALVAVLAWSYLDQVHGRGDPEFDPTYGDDDAREVLDAVIDELAPALEVERSVVCDLAASALLEAAKEADLVVVGARGLGGFEGLLLGSVSEAVLEGAPCPVAVIRGDGSALPDAPVVVAADTSEGALKALRWAADEARARQVRLDVVHAWHVPALAGMASPEVAIAMEEAGRSILDEVLADPSLEGLDVAGRLVCAGAAQAVMAAADDGGAGLIVAGTRGHGRLKRALLGSTSRQLSHHSPCPLVIVPTG